MKPYVPEPYSDFSEPASRSAYELALAGVESQLGAAAPVVVGGIDVTTVDSIESVDPARPDRLVAVAGSASADQAVDALTAAWEAFPSWAASPAAERAEMVHRLGDVIAARKFEFAAWMTFEAGKNWSEAEADVAEAVDFCRYYAHEAIELAKPVATHDYPGETNESFLIPMGAGVAIPPWNFPLAILVGMTVGPVAAGNTMVLKPASNTPMMGSQFMTAVVEAGIPPGVINFVPGPGATIGDVLVDHPMTRFINFTGSKEVGIRIAQRAAVKQPGQMWLKRAFMEMGGKDGIIVDASADLDAAAGGIVRSAYGFQGQKCSACSRVIAVDAIHDELLDRVVDRTKTLELGSPANNLAVGPVISAAQHQSILDEIDRGRAEAKLVTGGSKVDLDGGYYIEPTIFVDVEPDARLAQHEIFGPVLSITRVADLDAALDVANGTEFGLTGGIYSQAEEAIERARREFHVGNLYVNRKITGALVGVQPFGGFRMSGSNAKAGGPDYLRLFNEMKTVTRLL